MQQLETTFSTLFTLSTRLITTLLAGSAEFGREMRIHTGLVVACLSVLHNCLLLLNDPKWKAGIVCATAFSREWLDTPWLFWLLDHQCLEVGYKNCLLIRPK